MGHAGTDDDGDEHTGQDEESSEVVHLRQEAVQEQHNGAAKPCADDEADENVPRLQLEPGMHQRIHGNRLLSQDSRYRSTSKNPSQTVPPTGEESTDTTVLSSSYRSPVVN
jgi:hypothetical protein